MAQVRLKETDYEDGDTSVMHVSARQGTGDELMGPSGRLAYMLRGHWVGILGGEPTGARGSRPSRKQYALFIVSQKKGGGYDVHFKEALTKSEVEREEISKRLHHSHELHSFVLPVTVRNQRCQLITL